MEGPWNVYTSFPVFTNFFTCLNITGVIITVKLSKLPGPVADDGLVRTVAPAGEPGRVVGMNEIGRPCDPVAMVDILKK